MAIAHDSEILGIANTVAGSYDTSITPASTPNGVCVIIVGNSASDLVTSVVYGISGGAVALTRRRFDTESTEAGGVYIYWAGDSNVFPSGAQTVRVTRTGTTSLRAAISTMTVAAGKVVAVDSDGSGLSASVANPSWTHASLNSGVVAYLGIHSGLTSMTNTPAASWTLAPTPGFEDYGAQGRGWARRTLATAGSLGAGWTASTADDFVGASVAFWETDPPTGGPVAQLHRSPRPSEQHVIVGGYAPTNPSLILPGG
jgi:hypothetical protein